MLTRFFASLIALASVIAFVIVYFTAPTPSSDADVLYAGSILSSKSNCALLRPGHADPSQRRLEGTCEGVFNVAFDPDGTPDLVTYTVISYIPRKCARADLEITSATDGLPAFVSITRCFTDAPAPLPPGL